MYNTYCLLAMRTFHFVCHGSGIVPPGACAVSVAATAVIVPKTCAMVVALTSAVAVGVAVGLAVALAVGVGVKLGVGVGV